MNPRRGIVRVEFCSAINKFAAYVTVGGRRGTLFLASVRRERLVAWITRLGGLAV